MTESKPSFQYVPSYETCLKEIFRNKYQWIGPEAQRNIAQSQPQTVKLRSIVNANK